ncbi:MAG: hypothetical protein MZV64_36350 [Ignavibacteriales bacterium]|nr:hypothetical protein [Ignavibacteriales bacterium]
MLGLAVVPGGKRVGGVRDGSSESQDADERGGEEVLIIHGYPVWVDECCGRLGRKAASPKIRGRRTALSFLAPAESICITVSRLKLPLFWLGGYSLKDWMNWPAMACAGNEGPELVGYASADTCRTRNGVRSNGSCRRLTTSGTLPALVRFPVKRLPSITREGGSSTGRSGERSCSRCHRNRRSRDAGLPPLRP